MNDLEIKHECGFRGSDNKLFDTQIEAELDLRQRELEDLRYKVRSDLYEVIYASDSSGYRYINVEEVTTLFLKQSPLWISRAKEAIALEAKIRQLTDELYPVSKEYSGTIIQEPRKPNGFFRRLIKAVGL